MRRSCFSFILYRQFFALFIFLLTLRSRSFSLLVSFAFAQSNMFLVQGTLKGFDALVNLVLDNTVEYLQGWLLFLFLPSTKNLTLTALLQVMGRQINHGVGSWA